MAFGGYKFKGYKVVRANLATNTYANWCLLVHQARIKAFMESCALSGAQWHFSKTNGPLSFEDYGNVIYRVANANGDYHDYLSFFKYGDEDLYYMIATLGEYYTNTTSGSAPTLDESALFGTYVGTQTQVKNGGVCSCLALDSDFSDLGPFDTMPSKSLACSSVVCESVTTSSNAYSNESTAHGNGLSLDTIYIGFATKGKDVVNMYQKYITSIESGDAFSGYSSPNDPYGLLKFIFSVFKSDETAAASESARYYLSGVLGECLTDQGSSSFYKSKAVTSGAVLQIDIPTQAFYDSNNTIIPFGSATLTTGNGNSKAISSVGMLTKGVIKGELLSVNYTRSQSSQPAVGMVLMGGNLVTAIRCTPKTSSPYSGYLIPGSQFLATLNSSNTACPAAYVGWDPSNPSINDDSSWPELALQ